MLEPRYYQEAGVYAVWSALAEPNCNPLLVLPTGTGKALCIAMFIWRALDADPNCRIVVATTSREIVQQDYEEMIGLWPECPAGIYCSGLGQKNLAAQVIFASIGSIYKKAYGLQRVNLIIVDEAHEIPKNEETMWRTFIKQVKEINPDLQLWGASASPFRLDSGMLHRGEDRLFTKIAYEYPISRAISDGFLCEPITIQSDTQIDTSRVKVRGGEFIPAALEAAALDPEVIQAIADEVCHYGADRSGWGVFGCGVKHCLALRDAIRERGFSCEGIFATTQAGERRDTIEAFKRQEIRALVSVKALSTGFNAKHLSLVVLAFATKSAGRYIQSLGRGLRIFPGKENCLVLCYGGNVDRFGPIDKLKISTKTADEPGDMPEKVCPQCRTPNPIGARECLECGHEFDFVGTKIKTKAASGAILSSQIKFEWVDVTRVSYAIHPGRNGNPPSLRADYFCGFVCHRHFACVGHVGYPRQKACEWWAKHAPGAPVPTSAEAALEIAKTFPVPRAIQVRQGGKFVEILAWQF